MTRKAYYTYLQICINKYNDTYYYKPQTRREHLQSMYQIKDLYPDYVLITHNS